MATLCSARLHFSPITALVVVLSAAVPAAADPFAITAGSLAFQPVSGFTPPEVTTVISNLSGPDFLIPGGDSNPEEFRLSGLAIATADPLQAMFPVSGHIVVDVSAPLTVTHALLPEYCCARLLLDLTFTGASVPSLRRMDGVAGTGAFSVTGELLAFSGDDGFDSPVFRHAIAGSGVARMGFLLSGDEPPRPFATYTFEPAAPVPEPGTLVLFGMGAAVLARRRASRSWPLARDRRAMASTTGVAAA